ncbi:bZIP-type transcription factor MBZ1 [Trichoderma asperellum]|uniref:BZIP-type transcription factor MBZ1 n=1 Tax=Trichoderma asperellum TaxID=101201 RepID=A0A6V8R2V2_TRIAP|nr:bZIP-type transcription factor MBZ1 [Trichoderma asperellum]
MSGPNNVDIDALLDLSEYDGIPSYNSPSLSPSTTSKPTFASPVTTAVTTPSMTTTQALSGPSHNYDMYRQQTGFVPGAIANTMAVNESSNAGYQDFGSLDYLTGFPSENDMFDFNTSPSQATLGASDIMDFGSPTDSQLFPTVNPSNIEQDSALASPSLSSQASGVGRLWPGAHSQAAMAKAHAQQRQQQHIIQQQQAQRQPMQTKARSGKLPQPSDPIVEQKITQLLNSMRAKPAPPPSDPSSPMANLNRAKKDEEEMDEDERLLASEEGKKLSSKERRQLRNKVSARAFRSRRKEYISQLETEVATKVTENNDLRAQNRALLEENKRLSDLTRMLLSSPAFSNFLDHLSANPSVAAPPQVKPEPQPSPEQRSVKDVNPYGSQPSQHQIGMAMIPEQNVDFSLIGNGFNFQPRVFVVETSEVPSPIESSILSGKAPSVIEQTFQSEDEKVEVPVIERPVEQTPVAQSEAGPIDEEFEADPEFALYHSEPTSTVPESNELDTESLSHIDIFNGIESEKMLSRFELVDATEEEANAAIAMARVQSISASMEAVISRLEILTMDL